MEVWVLMLSSAADEGDETKMTRKKKKINSRDCVDFIFVSVYYYCFLFICGKFLYMSVKL